ncbi:alpha-L-fucosidase [Aeoliella sp. ICT_H6.2]|uniref:alpha-L-fucosidase n=1 Tax=Aeoliella straminimaris TaxID=2954799 RepID=A0A9X2FE25_9BACT|nr:alpha-L-fucosidase [Aeoliella straminimaris]MCO6047280.1 alpha-L-fucosidase [Aeoliella straminimaris]
MLRRVSIGLLLTFTCVVSQSSVAQEHYEPTWESLARHQPAPEWFRDAKFGIYFHWGVYSVPAYGNEWYPRNMHNQDGDVYRHHVEKYGDPAEYPYDRFVPQFTAEHFDADDWVELFHKAGARFVGPVAEHHDGFAMWDSSVTPWNAKDRGPKQDIMGDIAKAARQRDMKVVATFHHARNNLWLKHRSNGRLGWIGHYSDVKEHFPQLLDDPERAVLYGYMPREDFLDMWVAKLDEVIDQYSPDLIWFDSWLDEIPDREKMQFLAHYFNHAADKGQQVVVTYKQHDLPQDIGVLDLEKGGMGELTDFAWLTDDTISYGSWCYTDNLRIKEPKIVLHSLIDIVSKNGQLLLNVSPKADGTIPDDQRQVLLAIGGWLERFGEAIYETRPFVTYGHGPTTTGKGHFGGIATDKGYTAADIRYTRQDNSVYALQLGWPGAGTQVVLEAFGKGKPAADMKVAEITLLGSESKLQWQRTDEGIVITAPGEASDKMAVVYKLQLAK